MSETLDHKLTTLRLARIREVYPSWIEQAAYTQMGYGEFLEQLVTEELLGRAENQLRRKMKTAGFSYSATFAQICFQPPPPLKMHAPLLFVYSSFHITARSLLL